VDVMTTLLGTLECNYIDAVVIHCLRCGLTEDKNYVGTLKFYRPSLNTRLSASRGAVKQLFTKFPTKLLSCSFVLLQLPSRLHGNG